MMLAPRHQQSRFGCGDCTRMLLAYGLCTSWRRREICHIPSMSIAFLWRSRARGERPWPCARIADSYAPSRSCNPSAPHRPRPGVPLPSHALAAVVGVHREQRFALGSHRLHRGRTHRVLSQPRPVERMRKGEDAPIAQARGVSLTARSRFARCAASSRTHPPTPQPPGPTRTPPTRAP